MPKPDFAPTHFTYAECPEPACDLKQGDILEPTQGFQRSIADVHRYFLDDKYVAFMVLTQSCDLVRREDEPCSANYINLAAVRQLDECFFDVLARQCPDLCVERGVFLAPAKHAADKLLRRLLNQNEQKQGLFYLHEDHGAGLPEACVAFLQVSIALRAHEHYETLTDARTGRLTEPFRCKLGWLTGNLFARVATRDWEDAKLTAKVNVLLLGEHPTRRVPEWISLSKRELNKLKASAGVPGGIDRATLDAILQKHQRPPRKKRAIEMVLGKLQKCVSGITQDVLDDVEAELKTDLEFDDLFNR
ncbi:hypothetical protein HQ576_06565 [bacterium]|nr:hypothetical protein [bacterium]